MHRGFYFFDNSEKEVTRLREVAAVSGLASNAVHIRSFGKVSQSIKERYVQRGHSLGGRFRRRFCIRLRFFDDERLCLDLARRERRGRYALDRPPADDPSAVLANSFPSPTFQAARSYSAYGIITQRRSPVATAEAAPAATNNPAAATNIPTAATNIPTAATNDPAALSASLMHGLPSGATTNPAALVPIVVQQVGPDERLERSILIPLDQSLVFSTSQGVESLGSRVAAAAGQSDVAGAEQAAVSPEPFGASMIQWSFTGVTLFIGLTTALVVWNRTKETY